MTEPVEENKINVLLIKSEYAMQCYDMEGIYERAETESDWNAIQQHIEECFEDSEEGETVTIELKKMTQKEFEDIPEAL